MAFGGRAASASTLVIVGLGLTTACSEHKLVVLPHQDLPVRPRAGDDAPGAPGFDIVAGWEKPYGQYFDYAAGTLSWTDGHDVFVGSDFAHGVGLGLANPPHRWTSDESGIYWMTRDNELWTASRQRGARAIWRFKGVAYGLALGRTAAYLVIAPAGFPSPEALLNGRPEVQEIWRVTKGTGEASRLWSTKGRLGPLIVDGDVVFTANSDAEIRRIDGATGRHAVLSTGFGDVVGTDDRYVYGADGHAAYRAPKTGGRGEVLARLHREYGGQFAARFGQTEAVFEGGQLFWMEWPGLRTAPVQGGEEVLLAAMSGSDVRVIPGGDAVYMHDLAREMIYRVPRRGGPSPVEIPTGDGAVSAFTSNGSTLFWVAGWDIRKLDRNGTAVVVAADAKPDSDLAADDTHVYFTKLDGTLWRVPVSGGKPAKIADLRSRTRPRVTLAAEGRTVALRGDDIYFASFARGAVARMKKGGAGEPQILADGIPGPGALVLDGESMYLISADHQDVYTCKAKLLRLPASGGKPIALASDLPCWGDLATTVNDVWFGSSHVALWRVPKQGGTPTPVPIHGASVQAYTDLVAFTASGNSVFVSGAEWIMRFDEGKPAPHVVASGLLNPASAMWITSRTMYFTDLHSSKGLPEGHLYALELAD